MRRSRRVQLGHDAAGGELFVDVARRGHDHAHIGRRCRSDDWPMLAEGDEHPGQLPLRFERQMLNAFQVERAAVGQARLADDIRSCLARG